jgi:hypothetical protein
MFHFGSLFDYYIFNFLNSAYILIKLTIFRPCKKYTNGEGI